MQHSRVHVKYGKSHPKPARLPPLRRNLVPAPASSTQRGPPLIPPSDTGAGIGDRAARAPRAADTRLESPSGSSADGTSGLEQSDAQEGVPDRPASGNRGGDRPASGRQSRPDSASKLSALRSRLLFSEGANRVSPSPDAQGASSQRQDGTRPGFHSEVSAVGSPAQIPLVSMPIMFGQDGPGEVSSSGDDAVRQINAD
eukprot:2342427-Rhodomonas_salina.1